MIMTRPGPLASSPVRCLNHSPTPGAGVVLGVVLGAYSGRCSVRAAAAACYVRSAPAGDGRSRLALAPPLGLSRVGEAARTALAPERN